LANYPTKRLPRNTWKSKEARQKACRDKRALINKAAISKLKDHPCSDCGGRFPSVCMDFDHRDPSEKKQNVGSMATTYNLQTILDEIAKCDLVCANCHRIRTFLKEN
jgi:hypothetical protein